MIADILNQRPHPIPTSVRKVVNFEPDRENHPLGPPRKQIGTCAKILKKMRKNPLKTYTYHDLQIYGVRQESISTCMTRLQKRGLVVCVGIKPAEFRPVREFCLA